MKSTWNLLLVVLTFALDHGIHTVSARVCVLGTEPDQSTGGVRFVLPSGDPCSCTQMELGGHNPYAPPISDQMIYIDTLSMDAAEFRRLQGCPEEITQDDKETPETTEHGTSAVLTDLHDNQIYQDCQQVLDAGNNASGVYRLSILGGYPLEMYCDMKTPGQGFIVIQRRIDGSVDFNRSWVEYQEGFGDLEGEFWWGNEKTRQLVESFDDKCTLEVDLEAFDGDVARVRYRDFKLRYKEEYQLIADNFKSLIGDAGNALHKHDKPFSAIYNVYKKCNVIFNGGWWYDDCDVLDSNLNGLYYSPDVNVTDYEGIQWVTWKGPRVSLKRSEMMIRRSI